MPTLIQADDFVNDPRTSLAQLQAACEILGLEASGSREELRARLNDYLMGYDPEAPIVCLNPNVSKPSAHADAPERDGAGET
jgi:hypothetical protein